MTCCMNLYYHSIANYHSSGSSVWELVNKCHFWQIFVEATLKHLRSKYPILIIQSNYYVTLVSYFGDR